MLVASSRTWTLTLLLSLQIAISSALLSPCGIIASTALRTRSSYARGYRSSDDPRWRGVNGRDTVWPKRRRRTRADTFAVMSDKRPEGQQPALGDMLAPEELPTSGSTNTYGGVAAEPPGFLKKLFSVPKNVRRTAAVGDVVVPVIGARDGWGGIRQSLVNRGIFPGVEYRILEVTLTTPDSEGALASARDAPEGAFDDGALVFTLRPVYPLVARLERTWPVRVPAREFPVMLTAFSYNAATAWAALTTSLSLLVVGFVASSALTLSVIPSHSMEPTLQVGDVVLVEKVSRALVIRRGDIVFFRPPQALTDVVASVGGSLNSRDLFVKRVAGLPGDAVKVGADGTVEVESPQPDTSSGIITSARPELEESSASSRPTIRVADAAKRRPLPSSILQRVKVVDKKQLKPGMIFVLGDNPEVSMDSRVWGELNEEQIVGHALLRVFPLKAFGLLN